MAAAGFPGPGSTSSRRWAASRVAILGVFDPDGLAQLPDREQVKGLEVIPPEAALNRLLPEVRGKADLVILLSQFDERRPLRW